MFSEVNLFYKTSAILFFSSTIIIVNHWADFAKTILHIRDTGQFTLCDKWSKWKLNTTA